MCIYTIFISIELKSWNPKLRFRTTGTNSMANLTNNKNA